MIYGQCPPGPSTKFDQILRSFICPSLTKFTLNANDGKTKSYQILKQQYNIQELREVAFEGCFALPASSFLRDAPILNSLLLGPNDIMDGDTVMGISNGQRRFYAARNSGCR